MPELSADDKAKGKRIITQFFRTMPLVQKNLMTIFDREGYKGIHRIQYVLYPENSPEIDSVDTLRKGLSMILQHIYGMPVEDKESYFQDIARCKTPSQVVRKEKETLIHHFYVDLPVLKKYLLSELIEDNGYGFMTILCQKLISEGEKVADMRSFKNQIRNIQDALAERVAGGMSEQELIGTLKEYKQLFQEQQAEAPPVPEGITDDTGEASEKRQIILNIFNEEKYTDMRDFLIQKITLDPDFTIFQQYLDNILPSASRLVARDMNTFSEGAQKIKEFRDHLEQEFLSNVN